MGLVKRKSPKGQRARARIIDAAEAVFADRGFYGASVRDLAAAAGAPSATLLHHFPRKEALYGAVLERIASGVDRAFAEVIDSDRSDADKLRALCDLMVDWVESTPEHTNLLLRELLDNPARLEASPRMYLAPFVERVAAFVTAGRANGSFRDIDPDLFIVHLAGSVSYYCASRPTMSRIVHATTAALDRSYRADLVAWVERAVLPQAA